MSKKILTTTAITEDTLASLEPTKKLSFHDGASITSLDFDDTGQYLVSAGVDKVICVYDCHKGVKYKDIPSQKYGAHLARFTHEDFGCLYASTPLIDSDTDHSIRYVSISAKTFLRYFRGHKDQVVNLEVNPVTDTFITSSVDHTVKLWNLKASSPIGNILTGSVACVAFDPHGIIFVIAVGPHKDTPHGSVSFYDANSFERGPFHVTKVECSSEETWTKAEFSNNGKLLVIGTDSSDHHVIEALLGKYLAELSVTESPQNGWLKSKYLSAGLVCISPCGKFALCGSPKGSIYIFDLNKLKNADKAGQEIRKSSLGKLRLFPSKEIKGHGVARIIAFNPKLLNLVTADDSVILWSCANDGL